MSWGGGGGGNRKHLINGEERPEMERDGGGLKEWKCLNGRNGMNWKKDEIKGDKGNGGRTKENGMEMEGWMNGTVQRKPHPVQSLYLIGNSDCCWSYKEIISYLERGVIVNIPGFWNSDLPVLAPIKIIWKPKVLYQICWGKWKIAEPYKLRKRKEISRENKFTAVW